MHVIIFTYLTKQERREREEGVETREMKRGEYFRPYPGGPLLKKERKVKNRREKERRRGGTKRFKHAVGAEREVDTSRYENKIYCGDAEEVLKTFPDEFVDIIVTSPPYNFGQEYEDADGKIDDSMRWEHYFSKLNRIWRECVRVLKPGGRFCVNVQPLFSDYIPTHHVISNQLLNLNLLWKAEILWGKIFLWQKLGRRFYRN